jgi:hypothetical protein
VPHAQRPEWRLVAQNTVRLRCVVAVNVRIERAQLRRRAQQRLQVLNSEELRDDHSSGRANAQLLQRRSVASSDSAQRGFRHRPTARQAQRAQLAASPSRRGAKQRLAALAAVRARQVQLQPRGVVIQRRAPAAADLDAAQALLHRQAAEDGERERVRQRRQRVSASRRGGGASRRHGAAQGVVAV